MALLPSHRAVRQTGDEEQGHIADQDRLPDL